MRLAANLATEGDVNEVVIELTKNSGDEKEMLVLAEKESELLLRLVKRRALEDADLIQDRKALAALCTLHVSMKWLASRCKALRYISPFAVDTTNIQPGHARRWTGTSVPTLKASSTSPASQNTPTTPYLPLDETTATQFDAVLTSFTELSNLILRTLHVDLRLHTLHGIYRALNTTYALNQPYNDPDPAILDLSSDLNSYSTQLSLHLLTPQTTFLTTNIHVLANTSLISLVSSIPSIDTYGFSRMALNILVLQQTLKPLYPPSDLGKAALFYELGAAGPERVVKDGPKAKGGYAVEDLKAMVRLCYDDERDTDLGGREAMAAKLGGWPERKTSMKRKARARKTGGDVE
jgi:exocyst complex component 4